MPEESPVISPKDALRLLGTTVADKYAIETLVGEGGFAVVYRATHLIWKRPVAIKVFKALGELPAEDHTRLLEDFIREGALLAELSEKSTSICQARDIGMLTTPTGMAIPYMVLEWLEGRSLEAVLAEEREQAFPLRSIEQAIALLEPAAEGLALAHKQGVAHRDVKPANLFLLGDPRTDHCPVKVLDFGIAKVVQDAQRVAGAFTKTSGKITSFTPAYGAPEQFSRSYGSTGPWTDVFALALVLVEMVTGKPPLDGTDFMQIAYSSADGDVRPSPRTRGAVVSDAVEAVFHVAMAVAPADRYRTVGLFWNALRAAVGLDPIRSFGVTGVPPDTTGVRASEVPIQVRSGPSPPSGEPDTSRASSPLRSVPLPVGANGSASAPIVPRASAPSGLPAAGAPRPGPSQPLPPTMVVTGAGLGVETRPPSSLASTQQRATGGSSRGAILAVGGGFVLIGGILGAIAFSRGGRDKAPAVAPPPVASAPAAPPPPAPPACPAGMVRVEGGQFFMGSDDDLPQEKPAHNVTLAPFCIDRTEVTTEAYLKCSNDGKCKRAGKTNEWDGIKARDREVYDPLCNVREAEARGKHPINCVDWDMADIYCRAVGGRLPTESEWEFAARGPDGRRYPWGDEDPTASHLNACGTECVAWGKKNKVDLKSMYGADDGYPTTAPVGSFPSGRSRFGLDDVVGNVWEWVADWSGPYPKDSAVDPKGPAQGTTRVIRGGAWNGSEPAWVRPTFRYWNDPKTRSHGVGFRCAANPK